MAQVIPFAAAAALLALNHTSGVDITSSTLSSSCLANSYYGTYGELSVFLPRSADCVQESLVSFDGAISLASENTLRGSVGLFFVQESEVEPSIKETLTENVGNGLQGDKPLNTFLREITSLRLEAGHLSTKIGLDEVDYHNGEQVPLSPILKGSASSSPAFNVLHHSDKHIILSQRGLLSTLEALDRALPPLYKLRRLPDEPVALPSLASNDQVALVRHVLETLKFSSAVESLVSNLSLAQMRNDIQWLTGEDPSSPIISRHSYSEGARTAARWIADKIEGTGATCELKPFLFGFAPNVICRYPTENSSAPLVLLSAHYDSRGSFGSTRAPGGDDDGSGTTSILAIAQAIHRTRLSSSFHLPVELALFAGEEQGLLGSKAYAKELKKEGREIALMIQADMLAYRVSSEKPQLGLPATIGTPEVTQLVSNVSSLYSPELSVGVTSACCSDHQSFFELGYPSTQVFERAGPIADPMYHNSGDLSNREGYDLEQVRSIAKVQFASLLHVAGFDLPE